MAKSKAKWLAEATTRELVVLMRECIKDEDIKKANKVIAELLERIPEDDGVFTIQEAVDRIKADLDAILESYSQEAAAVVEPVAQPEEAEEEDEEEVKKPKKSRRSRKKTEEPEPEPQPEPEEDDDDDDDENDDEESGYEDMSQGELKKELRRRGIKVTKSMKKADMIRALEADDEE